MSLHWCLEKKGGENLLVPRGSFDNPKHTYSKETCKKIENGEDMEEEDRRDNELGKARKRYRSSTERLSDAWFSFLDHCPTRRYIF